MIFRKIYSKINPEEFPGRDPSVPPEQRGASACWRSLCRPLFGFYGDATRTFTSNIIYTLIYSTNLMALKVC